MHNQLFKDIITTLLILIIPLCASAQNHQARFDNIDVQHYVFDITVNDDSDEIKVVADVSIKFRHQVEQVNLDLVKKNGTGKGMSVLAITENNKVVNYTHQGNGLRLQIAKTKPNELRTFRIVYGGVPADGLIISSNKYGERTFFGDNWPDRAKNWLPVVDHPSDKSTVEWVITAPAHYQSIGNGVKVEDSNISDAQTTTRWKTVVPIPTKVMVIGVARFAVNYQGDIAGIPVSSWVYPQDRNDGFKDYAIASPILEYFIDNIGPYPFQKLANVQSKTRFGGMENAGNIFYAERSVDGVGGAEALIAHEVAHQWFGNSASELNWHHVWLSEGFATYFTNLYMEHKYGRSELVKRVKTQRDEVVAYARKNLAPVIDQEVTDYMKLLNDNSYEKGAWILHMLRRELGDDVFWKGIRKYYEQNKLGSALTSDLRDVMEQVSGKELTYFFDQWAFQAGHPNLDITWNSSPKQLILNIRQHQTNFTFDFPLDIKVIYDDGSSKIETVRVNQKTQEVKIAVKKPVASIELDPEAWLLFEVLSLKQQ